MKYALLGNIDLSASCICMGQHTLLAAGMDREEGCCRFYSLLDTSRFDFLQSTFALLCFDGFKCRQADASGYRTDACKLL